MPVCPSCHSEYEAKVERCPDCDVRLVERLTAPPSADEMVDLMACYDLHQVERLVDLLQAEGLTVLVRDRSSGLFPTTVGEGAQRTLAVPRGDVSRARALIADASAEGAVLSGGEKIDS